jgi:hypothetical protein
MMNLTRYHESLSDTVFEIARRIDDSKAVLVKSGDDAVADSWVSEIYNRGHVAYGTTHSFNFEIKTYRGKPTRKWFHAVIYRLDSGRYELTTYIL